MRLFTVSALLAFFVPARIWADGPYLYLLSKTLEIPVEMSPVRRGAHLAIEASIQVPKIWGGFHLGVVPGLSALAWSATSPPELTVQTLLDLKWLTWLEQQKKVKELAQVPHLREVRVLTTANIEVRKFLATRENSQGIVFLETDRPLDPKSLPESWGKPVPIPDRRSTRLRLQLRIQGKPSFVEWTPSLEEILVDHPKPIPAATRKFWSKDIDEFNRNKSWLERTFPRQGAKELEDLKLDASLVGPKGEILRFDRSLAQGPAVESILGKTWFQRLLKTLGKAPGRIPVSTFHPQLSCIEKFRALLK